MGRVIVDWLITSFLLSAYKLLITGLMDGPIGNNNRTRKKKLFLYCDRCIENRFASYPFDLMKFKEFYLQLWNNYVLLIFFLRIICY